VPCQEHDDDTRNDHAEHGSWRFYGALESCESGGILQIRSTAHQADSYHDTNTRASNELSPHIPEKNQAGAPRP
jgi:hypothetical protein